MSERSSTTRRQRVEAREGAIVAAAGELFAERDFDKVTVGEIGKRAGVAEGTVYLYFESKAALMRAVVEAFYRELTETAAESVRTIRGTRERLEFLAQHHIDKVVANRRILFGGERAFASESAAGAKTVKTRKAAKSAVGAGRTAGTGRGADAGSGENTVAGADAVTGTNAAVGTDTTAGTDDTDERYRLNRAYVVVFDDVIREGIDRGDISDAVPLWLLRDIFYGTLEYAARTTMIHERPTDSRLAVKGLLQTLEAGIMIAKPDANTGEIAATAESDASADRIGDVARRLEKVAARLEAKAPVARARK